jgi:hypothetical protein
VEHSNKGKAKLVNTLVETDPRTGKHSIRIKDPIVQQVLKNYNKTYFQNENLGVCREEAETIFGGSDKLDSNP